MANCNKCNRPLKKGETRGNHICDTIRITGKIGDRELPEDGLIVHRSRMTTDPDLREALDKKDAEVVESNINEPLRSIKDKFKKSYKQDESGAVLLGED